MKRIVLILLLLTSVTPAQLPKLGAVKGGFFSIGIGPRIPLGDFSISQNMGMGMTASVAYTDNSFLPVFFYGSLSFQSFSGKLSYYKKTDYSAFNVNAYSITGGVRYLFSPIVRNVVIVMPVVEGGFALSIFDKLHQFKIGSNKPDYSETITKTGFHVGVGISMFLLEVMANYEYFYANQFLSFELKLRVPIFIKI